MEAGDPFLGAFAAGGVIKTFDGVPIRSPEEMLADKPDYVLILPWNLKDEIANQLDPIKAWGGRCVVPIPKLQIL